MKRKKMRMFLLAGAAMLSLTACRIKGTEKIDDMGSKLMTELTKEPEKGSESENSSEDMQTEAATEKSTEPKTESQTEPETETLKWTVAIDAGHQGSWVDMSAPEPMAPGLEQTKAKATSGTTGRFSGVPEYELNLQVALMLRDELEKRDYRVVMAREDHDTAISNKERAELATAQNADISVRIHANGSDDGSVAGALTMSPSPSNPYLTEEVIQNSSLLSSYVLGGYCDATGLGNLGVMATDEMTGINWSTVPVTILEMGFMTNESDDYFMTDASNQEAMAKGIADGIDAYFADVNPPKHADAGKTVSKETAEETKPKSMTLLTELLEENYLNPLRSNGERWSVAVSDLTDPSVCLVSADQPMQSASVIKAFIMAAVYERAVFYNETGKEMIDMAEAYDGELRELLTNMITVSDNEAANELVRRLGNGDFDAGAAIINEFCQEHGFTATHMGRAFLAENPTDDNFTSALDCANLLTQIYKGELINADASNRMLELLKGQTRTGKIPSGVPSEVVTANKTGEMPSGYGLGSIENDIALVLDEAHPYVVCILSNDILDNGAAQGTIAAMSQEIYSYMTTKA